MNLNKFLKRLSESPAKERVDMLDMINIQNYASRILSETDMWILTNAANDELYLNKKLKEVEELKLDMEAPSEELSLDSASGEELTLDAPEGGEDDLSLDAASGEELTLDDPEGGEDDLSLDADEELTMNEPEGEEELSLDADADDDNSKPKKEIETSMEGVGILHLIAEIQEKVSGGKPSEIELAALKAIKKWF